MTEANPKSAPLIIAGATGYVRWPANSLEGARRCLAEPIDGLEIDVQMTADGHVVAHHDYHLNRHATRLNGQWLEARGPALQALSLAQLQAYDVGALRPGSDPATRYPHLQPQDGVRVPTLASLLEALAGAGEPKRLIYVEIKTDPQTPGVGPDPGEVTAAVIAAVEAADWVAQTKIIAFDWRVLRLAQARNRRIATAHLTIPAALSGSVRPLDSGDSPGPTAATRAVTAAPTWRRSRPTAAWNGRPISPR